MRGVATPPRDGLITTVEVCRRAGITYRMLNSWVVNGYVTPTIESTGSGVTRWWDEWQIGEVVEVREKMRPLTAAGRGGRIV